jgi:hypothetical protein
MASSAIELIAIDNGDSSESSQQSSSVSQMVPSTVEDNMAVPVKGLSAKLSTHFTYHVALKKYDCNYCR